MSYIAAGIAAGSGLIKLGTGIFQKKQANKIDAGNAYPTMPLQQEYLQNVRQAENMAQSGMPQQQYNNQANNINSNQASGIAALSRSANPGGNIAAIVRAGDAATGNLNANDAMQRNQNMLNLIQQRQQLAGQKNQQWDWNSRQKYLGLLSKANALRGAGMQNQNNGLNDVAGTALNMQNLKYGNTQSQNGNYPVNSALMGAPTNGSGIDNNLVNGWGYNPNS